MRIEGRLDLLQAGVKLTEKLRPVLGAHAFTVFAPQQPAVLLGERSDFIRNLANQRFLGGVFHIQRRANVQHPRIHMAKHAVGELACIQRGAELGNEVGQMFRRNGGVLHERQRTFLPLNVTQQAHRAFAHGVDFLDLRAAFRQGVAQPLHGGILAQVLGKRFYTPCELFRVIVVELDQVDALNGRAARREKFRHAVPNEVFHR